MVRFVHICLKYASMKNILILNLALIFVFSCKKNDNSIIRIITDKGNLEVEVYENKAPITATNFLKLCDDEVYKEASFYRVVRMDNQQQSPVKIEVIQGGLRIDSLVEMFQPIEHEITQNTGIKHRDGVISMARNKPGSASTEFFICIGDQPELDFGGKRNPDGQGFAAFGKVIRGMDVVRSIQAGEDLGQMLKTPVVIKDIVRKK